ncbi:hypothetical protein [Gloeocapsa sp. PCC 73106]|uniref:hypothetical protein n=1 Tax=Gloeocapsa sp. PCC 73106 TaxID=102232 RepID=UPI0002ACED4F|nr:hypothetical protein [Gloeocapsa sp. PCC 73106]ELR97875.1 hypothetical protein GLO73106DRAFT_00016930 [Gloeocapsa sp. PCC 73106]
MTTRAIIIFPYAGLKNKVQSGIFWKLFDCCSKTTLNPPIVVVSMETKQKGKAKNFYEDIATNDRFLDLVEIWAVDTCQRWLTGWGYVLDHYPDTDRLVLLPGDTEQIGGLSIKHILCKLEDVDTKLGEIFELGRTGDVNILLKKIAFYLETEEINQLIKFMGNVNQFIDKVQQFIELGSYPHPDNPDIIIGDYITGLEFSAKDLIDRYGTFPLLANWFPGVTTHINQIREIDEWEKSGVKKPRSEFLNIKQKVLRELLEYRPFAYEQTLNILIRSWDFNSDQWKYKLAKFTLGTIQDDNSFRQYRDCIDQIERTERMLRVIWKQINEPQDLEDYQKFVDNYEKLDVRSTAIRESATIVLRALLQT